MIKKSLSRIYVSLILLFLYTPIIVLIAMSFNQSQYNSLPFNFSLHWYKELLNNQKLIDGTMNSLLIALLTAIICVILATSLMIGFVQANKKVKSFVDSIVILPLTIPWIILGLALLLLINALGVNKNFLVLLLGHVIISFPYAALVIKARMQEMNFSINEASASLGANEWTTFRKITLPLISPAMLAGGFLAFMISFDNFIISYFLIPIGSTVLPVEIYSSIKFGFTPEINAISSIIIIMTLFIISTIILIMKSSLKSLLK